MRHLILRIAAIAVLGCLPLDAFAADPIPGVYALPDGQPKVSATLAATPGPGSRVSLDVTMTALGQKSPIIEFETELSKQLHVIAISSDFRSFVHEHGERPDADGHFRVSMQLPHPGSYHVYADGVPAGLGQQVMRFELTVGDAAVQARPGAPVPSGLEATDGRYAARFDSLTLRAGQESRLAVHLSRDGRAASDVTPFLGVAAHAVFINEADLTYVHVHAAPAAAPAVGATGASMHHDLTGTKASASHEDMADTEGMGAPLVAGSKVPPDLTLHVLAPKAGVYLLWIQFMAGGQVRTVPFVVAVA